MPVVPFTSQLPQASPTSKLPEPFALMAAATMHAQGRLVEKSIADDRPNVPQGPDR